MSKLISLLPLIPIRKEPDHRSEMTSQLLFGEKAILINEHKEWFEIVVKFDDYKGWIEKKSVEICPDTEYNKNTGCINDPFTLIELDGNNVYLPAGSEIPLSDSVNAVIIANRRIKLLNNVPAVKLKANADSIIEIGQKFLNAPYLWGGRTVMGIDCSGFIQLIYKLHGILLPRDAKDQAKIGKLVGSFDSVSKGDLAFFESDGGKITHVGIYMGDSEIIHASVSVRIDQFDNNGILNTASEIYTHRLAFIRRFI